jgi:glycosyltransferase involved in cell wall biosynthesis
MSASTIDVDILTANYNNGSYIERLLKSILDSSRLPRNIVIVDDGSTDNSLEIIHKYSQKHRFIKAIILPENIGFANALNRGIDHLESTYTVRIDSDDYLSKDRLEIQFNYMIAHPEVDVLGSNLQYFDSTTDKMLFKSNVSLSPEAIRRDFRNASCGIIHGTTIIRSTLLKKYKYTQISVPAEDYEIFSKMLKDGAIVHNIPDALTYVRVHINSVSNFLPFSTIRKTYEIANRIWGLPASRILIKLRYLHLKYYRLFLFNTNPFKKVFYISMSSILSPDKVVKRIYRK